jgi:hypothetical protein
VRDFLFLFFDFNICGDRHHSFSYAYAEHKLKGTVQRARWFRLKVVSFGSSLLKGELRRFSDNFASSPSCKSPLKIQQHLVQLLALGSYMPTAHTVLFAAFSLLHSDVGNGSMNKFRICFQWRNEYFKG